MMLSLGYLYFVIFFCLIRLDIKDLAVARRRLGVRKNQMAMVGDQIFTDRLAAGLYGSKIMPVCAKVQENVKQTIQNMTGITVSRVDVIVAGLEDPAADQHK